MHYSLAFSQPATGPSSVCEGSDVTLQCRILFNGNPQNSVWYRNGVAVLVGNDFIPNHNQILNSTTGAATDLVITDVTLDDNIVYTCNSTGDSITSSVMLNVLGKLCMLSMSLLSSGQSRFVTNVLVSCQQWIFNCGFLFFVCSIVVQYLEPYHCTINNFAGPGF